MACTEVIKSDAGLFLRNDMLALANAIEQAVKLKNEGKAKLKEPLSTLTFDPHLSTHMLEVNKLLK